MKNTLYRRFGWISVNMSKIIALCIHPPICSVHLFNIYWTPTIPGIDDTATKKRSESSTPWALDGGLLLETFFPLKYIPTLFILFSKKLVSFSKAEILSCVFYDARYLTNTCWTRFNKSFWRCRWETFQS